MAKSIIAFTSLMVVGLILIWGGMNDHIARKKSVVAGRTSIEIKKGDTLESVIRQLHRRRVMVNKTWFRYRAYRSRLDRSLKIGEYILKRGATTADILALLKSGKTRQYAITFLEGWNYKQIMRVIANNPNLNHTLSADITPQALMQKIDPKQDYPEGWFFPDTYYFDKHSDDIALLKRAYGKMQKLLASEWKKRDPKAPLKNAYEALIMASIIEKETAAAEERTIISGVFARRLKKNMLLQTDPTVIYGMGDRYHGNIRRSDLREPTPYNTYVNKGLPPTPISMPGKAAIVAAMHPADGNALFFVARGNGRHAFSATYAMHEKYVNQYQR